MINLLTFFSLKNDLLVWERLIWSALASCVWIICEISPIPLYNFERLSCKMIILCFNLYKMWKIFNGLHLKCELIMDIKHYVSLFERGENGNCTLSSVNMVIDGCCRECNWACQDPTTKESEEEEAILMICIDCASRVTMNQPTSLIIKCDPPRIKIKHILYMIYIHVSCHILMPAYASMQTCPKKNNNFLFLPLIENRLIWLKPMNTINTKFLIMKRLCSFFFIWGASYYRHLSIIELMVDTWLHLS